MLSLKSAVVRKRREDTDEGTPIFAEWGHFLDELIGNLGTGRPFMQTTVRWLGRGQAPYSVGSAYLLLPVSFGSASIAEP